MTAPRWNMESIFPSLESDEYKNALKELNTLLENQEALIETADQYTKQDNDHFDFCAWLDRYLDTENSIAYIFKTLSAYAYGLYSTDTTNTSFMNNMNLVEDLSIQIQQNQIPSSLIIASHQKYLDEFFLRFPKYEEYRYIISEIIDDTKHQMNRQEEKLAGELNRNGGNAWSMLQEQLISNMQDSNGKTFNELRNDANSADPELRKESYKKELALLEQNRIAFAASLNNLKGQTVTLNRKRNWNTALDRSLSSARLSKESLDALIGAIEDSLPEWRKYFQAKARLLRKANATASQTAGTETDPGLAFYDLFAPVEEPVTDGKNESTAKKESLLSKTWTFDEAKDYVLKEYYSFSKDMGDFAQKAFDENWIDAEVRPGKVGGAYDEDYPKGHQSRVLSNFTGVFSDIITLAHELGHAYHFHCMKDKDPLFFDYPMTLAESASTFAETIVKQDMLSQSQGFDRIRMLDFDLTDTAQVLVDILCRFYFERSVFESKESSELNADDFCRLMADSQEKSYGCGLNSERHSYMWAVKCHYYMTDLDFYNFPYAFGQLFAVSLYAQSKKQGDAFAEKYAELLSHTGSMSCEELCSRAGFDITKKEFWNSGIELYKKEIQEYVDYV